MLAERAGPGAEPLERALTLDGLSAHLNARGPQQRMRPERLLVERGVAHSGGHAGRARLRERSAAEATYSGDAADPLAHAVL